MEDNPFDTEDAYQVYRVNIRVRRASSVYEAFAENK